MDKLTSLDTENTLDLEMIDKAIYFAKKYHGSQLRKSGEPYYTHPLEVAYLFGEYTGEEERRYYTTDLLSTAILHDTIEDTELTYEMIAKDFNESIASKVDDLTRIKSDKKITAGETIIRLFLQNKKDVLYIKLFDRLHNMRTLPAMRHQKNNKISAETYDHFVPMAEYLKVNAVKEELINICSKYLPIKPYLLQFEEQSPFSYFDSFQCLSLIFQNNTTQMQNL